MLIVETFVAPSRIHGLGLFASKPIKSGTKMWVFDKDVNIILPAEKLASLHPIALDKVKRHSYVNKDGFVILSFDGSQYINHSEDPNMVDYDYECFALRDIKAGEEITVNYYFSEPKASQKLRK